MNYLEEETDGEAMINSIKNGDQPLPRVNQVSIAGTSSTEQPPLKDKFIWSDQEKKIQKIDRLTRSLLIQGLSNDIYSLIDSNKTAKDLWDALARHMLDNCELNFKFLNNLQPEWKHYATMMRQNKNLMDINIDALYNILKQNQRDVNDAMGLKKKNVVKITALLAKAFNRRKFYSKPTNNNLRTSSTSQSANKKQEFVRTDDKKVEKKDDEKKRDMSKVNCYNCKKEGHFAKDCKKVKVKDYEYYKTKMLLAKKDKDKQVLLAEDQAWMESSSDSDQEINANMVFMAKIEKVILDSKTSSSFADDKISEVSYYLSESESEYEFKTSEYYDNSTNYSLFMNNDDDQEIFHDAIESASENFIENHIDSQKDYDKSEVDHNDSEAKDHLVDKLIRKFNKKIAKCLKRIKKANQQNKDFENQNKDLQDKYDVLKNQATTFETNNKELNEQLKVLIKKNDDLLAQTNVLKDQLQVKHVVIDNHVECQERYAKLEAERYDKDLEIEKCLERLNVCENKLHKMGQTNQTVYMIMPSKDTLYNGRKEIGFENPSYFEKAKDLRPSLYNEKVIGLGYTLMFLTHFDEALEIEKFKRARENKIEFAYDYESLNASYVNEKINFSDDYFQKIINPNFDKIDSPFQQTSSLKPYVPTAILEKIIIDLEDEVVSLLEKEKANLETIESLKSKGFESSKIAISELENQSENDCQEIEKFCDRKENPNVIAPRMFKLNGVDLLTGDRLSNLYTIALNEVASNSLTCLLAKAFSSQSWLWHQRLSHLNFASIYNLVKNNLVQGLPKMKFEKDHLCSAYEQGKIHQKHHKSKTDFASNKPLYLLHIDLCGPMRVKSINGKRYVLVVVDDYSWYTWVFFLHYKDEASEVIISFIKKIQVNLQLQVQRVRTDNGTEFKNKTLAKFFDEVGITQQFSAARTQQQNGVVERRNQTLVEATRTMLTFANLPSFLWAKAIVTSCFTKNLRFGNNDFAVIAGYGDVVIGSMTIKKVYYVEGLGHNLFSVGKFCDKGLEVAFRKSTCLVRTEDGVDLLTGDGSSNLDTIALNEVASNSSTCLLAKASSSQSWLWHRRFSHLNFATINNLMKNNLVQCLPKMKFEKDHLCSSCEQGKIHQKHHKSKMAFASNKALYLLHMDLCGPLCIESINGKRYVLVVVDDYSRYTWVFFLHSKDEASGVIISFIKKTQVNLQLQDHPLYKITSDLKSSVRTRAQLANSCLLSSIETANVAEALRDDDWVSVMQDELDQFARLKEVYVGKPPGLVSKQYPNYVYALDKALYGLKQAPPA
nr:putative ribonuclease H-like domain-containing protein [Tanacetum cinerariifolium]